MEREDICLCGTLIWPCRGPLQIHKIAKAHSSQTMLAGNHLGDLH